MRALAKEVREAARSLAAADRDGALRRLATALQDSAAAIQEANALDREENPGLSPSMAARLVLDEKKLATLAAGIRSIADAPDPLGRELRATELSPGLELRQLTCPIGVLLVIFESRPDVLPQVGALAVKSGNGLLLKGGSEARHSCRLLHRIALDAMGLGPVIGLVEGRADVGALLELDELIDLVIPRGSNALVRHIQGNTRIPVLGHADGVCHVYVDAAANLDMARAIVLDAKTDYPAACNAMETLLVHRDVPSDGLVTALERAGVTVHREPADWHTEYSELACAVRTVDSLEQAVEHIHRHGSGHTEAIVTDDDAAAARFLAAVDSACVFHNASTRFADGFRFGLGAEVGISTSRIHARGPVGVEGLLTTRWKLVGDGHTAGAFSRGEASWTHRPLAE